jgi:hypothetical protein
LTDLNLSASTNSRLSGRAGERVVRLPDLLRLLLNGQLVLHAPFLNLGHDAGDIRRVAHALFEELGELLRRSAR